MILTSAELIAWGGPNLGADTTVTDACIAAAQSDIERITGRTLEQASFTDTFDGDQAQGKFRDTFWFPALRVPVAFNPPTDQITVTENGVALTVASGYSTTAQVVVANVGANANLNRLARMTRQGSGWWPGGVGWSPGTQNIVVTYKGGFTTANLPAAIKEICKELAWLYYKSGRTIGSTSGSAPSRSSQNPADIPPMIVKRLQAWQIFA